MSHELDDELDLLRSMYNEDEISIESIGEATRISATLLPRTSGNEQMQLSCCELHILIGKHYPEEAPALELGSSRGLSDSARSILLNRLKATADDFLGQPLISMLLESGHEVLTELNGRDSECSICLSAIETITTSTQVARLPCFHVFHESCLINYCRSELDRHSASMAGSVAACKISCPECRGDFEWSCYTDFKCVVESHVDDSNSSKGYAADAPVKAEAPSGSSDLQLTPAPDQALDNENDSNVPEAFVRLHHLWQGRDEKEKPLLRLLKELQLNARVYYGKPSLMHIQGSQKDVESFPGLAKRRHITISIDVVQHSTGPRIPRGISAIAAKKNSLDSAVFAEHLRERGLGETSFTVIGT